MEAFLHCPDQAWRSVGSHQERVAQSAPLHVLDELAAAGGVLLGPPRQAQEGPLPLGVAELTNYHEYEASRIRQMQHRDVTDEQAESVLL
jgi:hypothetical protein